jgi:hypothetical protein
MLPIDTILVIAFIIVVWLALLLACVHGDAAWAAEQERRNE